MVAMAAGGAIAIANSNWIRYLANPTVVSLQKDFRNWQNPFPAVTGCFVDKTNKKKVEKYILEKWRVNSSEPLYDYYVDFIRIVANASYDNLKEFGRFLNDTNLQTVDMLEIATEYYVHSYLDVVHATIEPPLVVHESEELEINYRMQETESSLALRDLTPSQRKCRFYDEPIVSDIAVYSSSICYMMCRYKLAIKLCGCRPFFYHNFGGKICNVTGLVCLSKYFYYIMKPPSQIGCQCPQPCDIVTYFPQVPKFTK
ncbi:pickpocket protein 11-like, partial [Asbolus verrucosus]